MTEEMRIEELLNSYIDGELSVRQRTQIKRMAANDPNIEARLKQLQKCRALVSALPAAQAPACIMENVKASLQARERNNHQKMVLISEYREKKTGSFVFRRVFAAAAMISIAAVLVIVINMLTPSDIEPNGFSDKSIADMRFSGKLELKTNDFRAVDSMISRAIENSGLAKSMISERDTNRRIYTLNCSREGLNKLLNELNANWDKLYSAELFVDTENFGENVEIKSITPSQIVTVVNQTNTDQLIQTARDFAVINSVRELLQDKGVTSPGGDLHHDLLTNPQPIEVQYNAPQQHEDGAKTVQFRIILSR
jgi:hypothetical protein